MTLSDYLRRLPAFREVTPSALAAVVDVCDLVQFKTRDTVLDQGGDSDVAYLVVTGMLEVSVQTEHSWHHIAEVHPGDVVGESALFVRGVPRNATVFAHKDSQCLVLRPSVLERMVTNEAIVALEVDLIGTLSRRIKKTNLEIQSAWSGQLPAEPSVESDGKSGSTSIASRLRSVFRGRGRRA
jgi:CRP-like cAMP-binding protein